MFPPVDRRRLITGAAAVVAVIAIPQSAAPAAMPADPIFAAIEKHTQAKVQSDARYAESSHWYREAERLIRGKSLKKRNAFVEAKLGCDPDVYTTETAAARWQAVDEALCTEPTTLAGVLALLRFAEDLIVNDDRDLVEENSAALVTALAASIEALVHRGLA